LHEIRWKRHRNDTNKRIIKKNVLEEIADIFKYTISLAQIWGFDQTDLLEAVHEKGEILDFRLQMEFKEPLQGRKILITDMDGTIADYVNTFVDFLKREGITPVKEITSMLLDESLEMDYPEYYKLKEKFEEEGGYRDMLPYTDAELTLERLKYHNNYHIIVVTSRPVHIHKRIFKDSFYWLKSQGFPFDELRMMGANRILLAHELMQNNEVILWEDDPEILKRASLSGITTYARKHPYNANLNLPHVTLVDSYTGGKSGRENKD